MTPSVPLRASTPDRQPETDVATSLRDDPANVALLGIVAALEEMVRRVDAYLAEHPAGCPCRYCGRTSEPNVREDLVGIRWAMTVASASIDGTVIQRATPEKPAEVVARYGTADKPGDTQQSITPKED